MNNKMEEVSLELESVNSTEESVTHVAFASDKSEYDKYCDPTPC